MQALADVSPRSVINRTAEPLRPSDIVTRTQAALSQKAAIDTATGMLAATATIPIAQAAQALHDYSTASGGRPADTAHALVHRTLAPQTVLHPARQRGEGVGRPVR